MAYDEQVADRVRHALTRADAATVEQRMFGGLAFMVRGHMTVGVMGSDLMVRVGKDGYQDALAQPNARPMDFTGKPMKTMVMVSAANLDEDELDAWVQRGLAFTSSLPPK